MKGKANSTPRKLKGDLEEKVKECLIKLWSPDQISGRLKNEGVQISHTTIYKYVHKNKDKNGINLSFLRHGGRKYRAKTAKIVASAVVIPDRVDISECPEIVETKSRIGDLEGDSIVSHKSHCVILTLVDRKSKFLIAKKVGKKQKKT